MTSFRYTAISKTGERVSGVMEAAAETEVIQRLQRQGNMPLRAERADASRRGWGWIHLELNTRRGLRKQDVADLIRELATMLTAGQDLDRAAGWPDARTPVVVVGHQPVLGQVASLVFSGVAHDWKIRKASVFWIASKGDEDPAPFVRLAAGPDLIGKLR